MQKLHNLGNSVSKTTKKERNMNERYLNESKADMNEWSVGFSQQSNDHRIMVFPHQVEHQQLLGLDFLNSLLQLFLCPLWHFVVICIFAVFVSNLVHALQACKQRWGLHAYTAFLVTL